MRRFQLLAAAAALALLLPAPSRAEEAKNTLKFSDPAKAGTLKVALARGNIQIQGADTAEVTIMTDAQPHPSTPRADGLRVLTESASYSLGEKDNVITLDALSDGWAGVPSDFRITVPRNTNVTVSSAIGGDIACTGVTGDIEIKSLNGEVKLGGIVSGALVETTNGEITADIHELHDNKPVSLTSTNGAVVLKVPPTTKANVRLRTQNGSILTDFDEKALVTKVESVAGSRRVSHGILTPEAREAFREAARAGAEAARRAAEAVREAAEAAREGADADDDTDGANHHQVHSARIAPIPPIPSLPAIPTITGGKIVTGTLNGGGPEINIATMNGDVTLRKLDK